MKLSRQQKGNLFILGSGLLWGLFPIITILSYHAVSPFLSLTISSLFAAILFAGIVSIKKKWYELNNRRALINILLATLFTGILYYLLLFLGLQFTSPGNASIVSLTETFFSFLFFHVLRKEHLPRIHILGALFIVFGAFIVLAPNLSSFHLGDLLVLCASAIAPFGNFFAQRARKEVTTEMIMFVRSLIASAVIFLLILVLREQIIISTIQKSLFFLILNGILLLGLSKILWIDGIHRISVPKANALGSTTPILTLIFAWIILNQVPTWWQLFSILPICAGVVLLSKKGK